MVKDLTYQLKCDRLQIMKYEIFWNCRNNILKESETNWDMKLKQNNKVTIKWWDFDFDNIAFEFLWHDLQSIFVTVSTANKIIDTITEKISSDIYNDLIWNNPSMN